MAAIASLTSLSIVWPCLAATPQLAATWKATDGPTLTLALALALALAVALALTQAPTLTTWKATDGFNDTSFISFDEKAYEVDGLGLGLGLGLGVRVRSTRRRTRRCATT